MWEILGVVVGLFALIISMFALVAAAVFYFMSARQLRNSTRRLQRTINVLGHYLKATIKDADVDLNINKEGDIVGLNITLRLEGVQAKATVGGMVPKKPD
jgi:hypothetical protein